MSNEARQQDVQQSDADNNERRQAWNEAVQEGARKRQALDALLSPASEDGVCAINVKPSFVP